MSSKKPVVGYIVRIIHEEDRVKDVVHDPRSHILYPAFGDALSAAHELAINESDRVSGRMIVHMNAKSESTCAEEGSVKLFEITGYGYYSITAHSIYAATL
jgi:hypothetical protein